MFSQTDNGIWTLYKKIFTDIVSVIVNPIQAGGGGGGGTINLLCQNGLW